MNITQIAKNTIAAATDRHAPSEPVTGARMPCGACVTNVYEAYEAGKRAALAAATAAQPQLPAVIEQIAQQWDGCVLEAVGENIDAGAAIRDAGRRLLNQAAATAAQPEELPPLPLPQCMEWPEYHYQGMGCGLEDRGITDRYEAMQYGWDEAMERAGEVAPEEFYTAEQMREYARAALAASPATGATEA